MKAAVLTKLNSPLEIWDIEATNLVEGQVLVKVLSSGICGSQLHEIKGNKGNGKFLPHLMGHEGCGIVVDIGSGVSSVKKGDKVVMHWRPGVGIESPFPTYIKPDGHLMSSGKVTTLSEYSIASENRLTCVPNDTNRHIAAMLGCSLTTALGVFDNEVDLKLGETVLITGCGGVGLNLVQAASIAGASRILAFDAYKFREQDALFFGATDFLDDLQNVALERIDVVIDTTGHPTVIDKALKLLSDNGRLVLVGQPPPQTDLVISNALSLFNGRGLQIKATQGGQSNPTKDIPRYLELFKYGKLKNIVSHVFDIHDVNTAFDLLRTGEVRRIMIDINKDDYA